jgi:hypothetical protein
VETQCDRMGALSFSTVLCIGLFPYFLMGFSRIQTKPFLPQYNILNPNEKLIMNSLIALAALLPNSFFDYGRVGEISSSEFKRRFSGFNSLTNSFDSRLADLLTPLQRKFCPTKPTSHKFAQREDVFLG